MVLPCWLSCSVIPQRRAAGTESFRLIEQLQDRSALLLLQLAFTAANAAVRMIAVGSMDASERF
jgi:hypothetical protein